MIQLSCGETPTNITLTPFRDVYGDTIEHMKIYQVSIINTIALIKGF